VTNITRYLCRFRRSTRCVTWHCFVLKFQLSMRGEGMQLSQSRFGFAVVILSLQATTSVDSRAESWTTRILEVINPCALRMTSAYSKKLLPETYQLNYLQIRPHL
jgi:hypothetical protein